jgi:16S rRNA (adenine1518-N6/adenine1519-N6)-dimethyltransferase
MTFSGHRARKRFGQHWLTDPAVLERIVAAAAIEPGEHLLEVGPGRGALTERLLASPAASLLAVELDRDLVLGLRQRFGADPRFQLVEGDVLAVALEPAAGPAPEKVVANIPYNITGPLLERLLGRLDRPLECPYRARVLLVQQEVGERIRASPGSSAYSALSVRMQLLARCQGVCLVPPRCFTPPPKVQSEVIRLEPLPPELRPEPALARATEVLLRRCFAARRKMLRNTLAGLLPEGRLDAVAAAAGVALSQRPQELAPQRWLALAAGLQQEGLQGKGPQGTDLQETDLHETDPQERNLQETDFQE